MDQTCPWPFVACYQRLRVPLKTRRNWRNKMATDMLQIDHPHSAVGTEDLGVHYIGDVLAELLAHYRETFPTLDVPVVEAGEEEGKPQENSSSSIASLITSSSP